MRGEGKRRNHEAFERQLDGVAKLFRVSGTPAQPKSEDSVHIFGVALLSPLREGETLGEFPLAVEAHRYTARPLLAC